MDADEVGDLAGAVGARLRSWLEEAQLGGLPVPDRMVWERRFPAHVGVIARLFDAGRDGATVDVDPSVRNAAAEEAAPAPESAPGCDTRSVDESAPAGEILRTGAHGSLHRMADGRLRYRIPASRLGKRSPAMDYLRRIRRAAGARVPGIERARLRRDADGGASVIWKPLGGCPGLKRPAARATGFERDAVEAVAGAAGLLERLHAAGGAHGRLAAADIRFDRRRRRTGLVMGYDAGPGRDGADVAALQAADIRALGAMLYGVFAGDGSLPETEGILSRHAADDLPALRARRPRLLPALAECTERALATGRSDHGFAGIAVFRASLDRILAFEGLPAGPETRAWRRRPVLIAAAALLLVLLAALVAPGLQARNDDPRVRIDSTIDQGVAHVRALLRAGRQDDAREAWNQLARDVGVGQDDAEVREIVHAPAASGSK